MSKTLRFVLATAFTAFASGSITQDAVRRPAVSVPEFAADNPADTEIAQQIARAVGDDLRKSGKVAVVEPAGDNSMADARVEGRVVRRLDGRIDIQTRLWDLATESMLSGHQYTVDRAQWHVVAGAISDSIREKLVGNPATPARK